MTTEPIAPPLGSYEAPRNHPTLESQQQPGSFQQPQTETDPGPDLAAQQRIADNVTSIMEAEVTASDESRRFTILVKGEEIELVDKATDGRTPLGLALMNRKGLPQERQMHYILTAIDDILGEDQLDMLLEKGMSAEELPLVIKAWTEARGLGESRKS